MTRRDTADIAAKVAVAAVGFLLVGLLVNGAGQIALTVVVLVLVFLANEGG